MFKLDNDFLQSLGLGGLPVEEKNRLLQMIYERLEMNVGMRLAEKMSDQQLDEFEGFIDRNDEAGALKWLESNFPNYKDVVAEELEKLKKEVETAAPQILAASPAAAGGQPGQMPPIGQEPIMPGLPPQPQPYPQAPPAGFSQQLPGQPPHPSQFGQQPAFQPPAGQATPPPLGQPLAPPNGYGQPPQPPMQQPAFGQPMTLQPEPFNPAATPQPFQPSGNPPIQQPQYAPQPDPSQPTIPHLEQLQGSQPAQQAPMHPSSTPASPQAPSYGQPAQAPQPPVIPPSADDSGSQPPHFTPPPADFNPGQ